METFDAIVIGLGAHGSAATLAVARRGLRVLGLDLGQPGHELGSSGGRSRMIRRADSEDPLYLPLLGAAWAGWRALEAEAGVALIVETGGLYMGEAAGDVFRGSAASAREQGLAHEVVDAAEIHRRWPLFRPGEGMAGLLDPGAAMLRADVAIEAQLRAAAARGADLRFGVRVIDWRAGDGGTVTVETEAGEFAAGALVIAAGAWTGSLVPDLGLPVAIERVPVFWFEPPAPTSVTGVGVGRLPVWLMETAFDGTFYGFPDDPELGLKVGRHFSGEIVDPDRADRTAGPADRARVGRFVEAHLAGIGRERGSTVCLYASTPDHHFIIGTHPAAAGVAFASACSGHGFKFAPVVGEMLADLALTGVSGHPVERFRLERFAG